MWRPTARLHVGLFGKNLPNRVRALHEKLPTQIISGTPILFGARRCVWILECFELFCWLRLRSSAHLSLRREPPLHNRASRLFALKPRFPLAMFEAASIIWPSILLASA